MKTEKTKKGGNIMFPPLSHRIPEGLFYQHHFTGNCLITMAHP